MSKKAKTVFVCQECGYESPKWIGQCVCGAWNSMVEEKVIEDASSDIRSRNAGKAVNPYKLTDVTSGNYNRISSGIKELDRVLGGGIVQGSLVLISGEPGIGKSTLILQAVNNIAKTQGAVLYVSGEESEEQIKMRADRVCGELSDKVFILAETNMENIDMVCEKVKPKFLVIDSIQTMYSDEMDSAPGSVSQVRVCGNMLMKIAKTKNLPIFVVAHVTKSGELAGPKTVEHLVDCVLHFTGERDQELRILRSFKNRFGTTNEIGAFTMENGGLIQIDNLSGSLLELGDKLVEGAVTTAVYEGSRAVLFEIQALVAQGNPGFAKRTAIGVDYQRVSMLLAVLEKRAYLNLSNQDVYVNVVGGLRPDSTSTDLAVEIAIYSSAKGVVPVEKTLVIGEVDLTGQIRMVNNSDKIVSEATRLGYEKIILPKKNADKILKEKKVNIGDAKICGVTNIYQAIKEYGGENVSN